MKVGSFLMILLVALVALGYLLSDSLHLHEDVSNLQKENGRLAQELQKAEQAKQDALMSLQTVNQNLQSCQQSVEQANQTIANLTEENAYLKDQYQLLTSHQSSVTSNAAIQSHTPTVESAAYSLIALVVLGIGSLTIAVLKGRHMRRSDKQNRQGKGHYVCLTEAEIQELVQWRRRCQSSSSPHATDNVK